MPKTVYPKEKKEQILSAYCAHEMTVPELCARYHVPYRTLYAWIEKKKIPRNGVSTMKRKALYMSREEIEAMLLLILEGEKDLPDRYKATVTVLENKLLNAADYLDEYNHVKE